MEVQKGGSISSPQPSKKLCLGVKSGPVACLTGSQSLLPAPEHWAILYVHTHTVRNASPGHMNSREMTEERRFR